MADIHNAPPIFTIPAPRRSISPDELVLFLARDLERQMFDEEELAGLADHLAAAR